MYDGTRTSGLTYYQAGEGAKAGLLKTETVEPGNPDLCVKTTYEYDDYGNKTKATASKCAGVSAAAGFDDRISRSDFTSGPAQSVTVAGVTVTPVSGTFAKQIINAKGHVENHVVDPRFGTVVALTGPNQIATNWQLDDFGRKVAEIRADGTQTNTAYCTISGRGVDTGSNSPANTPLSGCTDLQAALVGNEVPSDAIMFVYTANFRTSSNAQIGPASRVYMDRAGRKLRTVTEGFDGDSQLSNARLIVQDIGYSPLGVQVSTTQPYFLGTGTSTTTGSIAYGQTRTDIDALGRPIRVAVTDPMGNGRLDPSNSGSAVAAVTTITYQGLTTTTTNDASQRKIEDKSVAGQTVRVTDTLQAQVAHEYDAFGNLLFTVDALGNKVVMTYDLRGNKLTMSDPDSGNWNYGYDALGQLKWQQSAKQIVTGTKTTMEYDLLGRMTQRIDPGEATSTWNYDTYADGLTKCSAAAASYGKLCQSQTDTGVTHKYSYDDRLRPKNSRTDIVGGPSTASAVTYDDNGRLATQTFPTGLQLQYDYTGKGFLKALRNVTTLPLAPLPATSGGIPAAPTTLASGALWTAVSYNAWGQAEQYLYASGVISKTNVDPVTGRLTQLTAGLSGGSELLDMRYAWNDLGQITSRTDANGAGDGSGAVTDSLRYDGLGRISGYDVSGNGMPGHFRTVELRYNAGGMLLYKSDVGTYNYYAQATPGVKPHALQSLTSNTVGIASAAYGYDANGNLVTASAGKYRSIEYTSFNLPSGQQGIQGPTGGSSYAWFYDENHQRIKEVRTTTELGAASTHTTWMMHPDNAGGLGFESETTVNAAGTNTSNRHYLSVGGVSIGVIVSTGALPTLSAGQQAPPTAVSLNIVKIEYWHKDQLGSLVATSDHRGLITARYGFDPFGKRRMSSGGYDASGVLIVTWTNDTNNGGNRGYTGHEQLDDVGLIHMNGRIYDPTLGRFLQADPFIQDPSNLQNFNRYGYCFNNPMTCSDPTGLSFNLGKFLGSGIVGGAIDFFFPGVGSLISGLYQARMIAHTAIGYQIGSIVISVVSSVYCSPGAAAACNGLGQAAWSAMAGYSADASLKTGLMSAASTFVNGQIHTTFDITKGAGMVFGNTLAHGVWGCAETKIGGGSCGAGFRGGLAGAALSNYGDKVGLGQYGDPQHDIGDRFVNTAIHAFVGGVSSVAGGGKFWDGAKSSAMAYLFNALRDRLRFIGGTESQRQAILTSAGAIDGTQKGKELDASLVPGQTIAVTIVSSEVINANGSPSYRISVNAAYIDGLVCCYAVAGGGLAMENLDRILAHEFGHVAGVVTEQKNVDTWENSIMRQLTPAQPDRGNYYDSPARQVPATKPWWKN